MANDFFVDIKPDSVPPRDPALRPQQAPVSPVPPAPTPPPIAAVGGERSIRNIAVPTRRVPITSPRVGAGDIRQETASTHMIDNQPRARRSRLYIWIVASLAVVLLGASALFVLWGGTTVTVTPRTHQISFDDSTQFTAYIEGSSSTSTITYMAQKSVIEDSVVVPATGTEKAADRASGTLTVYNEYSKAPVRLIKNTRFQAPTGLVYRVPASIEVPGQKGKTPGQITVTVIADQPGENYNSVEAAKFTLPGLKSTPDMYRGVYAKSSGGFSGGFVGDKPAVSKQALETARSEIRGRLLEKVRAAVSAYNSDATHAFPELVHVVYESLPTISESASDARVSERVTALIPVFGAPNFAQSIAQAVSADASLGTVALRQHAGFTVKPVGEFRGVGTEPIKFTISGSAILVWHVDSGMLAQALAGKDQGAFETVIGGFSGVEKAEASIAPFWKNTFPNNPDDIEIILIEPTQP